MSITETISRLDEYVRRFFDAKDVRDARMAGEAICKIIILDTKSGKDINVAFNKLIELLTPTNTSLQKLFLSKITHELKALQLHGNSASHDNNEEIKAEDINKVSSALINLLGYLFDSKDEYNLDFKVPTYIYELLNQKKLSDENWRCHQIISTIYPNRSHLKNIKDKDFDFYIVEDADNRHLGFLSLNRNIGFKDALSKVLIDENIKALNSLTFLFPLEISKTTGTPVKNRKEFIQKTSAQYLKSHPKISCGYYFYEDYIWEKCLPNSIKVDNDLLLRPDFIDQNLYINNEQHLSLEFVDSLVSNLAQTKKPLNIIFGEGGVGKTTFCEQAVQKINSQLSNGLKKKAIFISSIDIPEDALANVSNISSIEDLYSLIFNNDEDTKIEKNSLALNISCGNLIIIIDGLDEILSKLKNKFIVKDFFDSIKNLNDTYRNCTIIITSREIQIGKFDEDNTNIFYLKGFNNDLIGKYLNKRFKQDQSLIDKAYANIKNVSETKDITPLIIRLISDLTKDNPSGDSRQIECSYLDKNNSLDKVLLQLIAREIQKQSLGMNGDQYFMLLQSIVFESKGKSKIDDFREQIKYILSIENNKHINFDNEFFDSYLLSPLLTKGDGGICIKYDSIEFLIKARYLTHIINFVNENQADQTINPILAQDCFKGGALVKEISLTKIKTSSFEKNRIQKIISSESIELQDKKLISALLYIYFSVKSNDRFANAEYLTELFGTTKIKNISIFGDFYPIDFTKLTIDNGYFDGFSNLSKSLLPKEKTVFNNCKFINFNWTEFGRNSIYSENFNSDCDLSEELKKVLETTDEHNIKKSTSIEDDLIKIFKVGYRNGSFSWKSSDVYKQQCATLKTKFSLPTILSVIEGKGLLLKERAKASSLDGYKVNAIYAQEIKDFITQRILGEKIDNLIEEIDNR